jgi:histidine triad (HIT) family protein
MSLHAYREGCPFCIIARGEGRNVEIVCREASWLAFFPLEPATPGHTLIIPLTHVEDLWQADTSLAADLMVGVERVGHAIERALAPHGLNLITSAGSAAEQTVFHLHLHVVPRWQQDGFGQIWPTGSRYENAALGDAAARVREACGSA